MCKQVNQAKLFRYITLKESSLCFDFNKELQTILFYVGAAATAESIKSFTQCFEVVTVELSCVYEAFALQANTGN